MSQYSITVYNLFNKNSRPIVVTASNMIQLLWRGWRIALAMQQTYGKFPDKKFGVIEKKTAYSDDEQDQICYGFISESKVTPLVLIKVNES